MQVASFPTAQEKGVRGKTFEVVGAIGVSQVQKIWETSTVSWKKFSETSTVFS